MSFSRNMQKIAKKLTHKYGEDVTLVHRYDCIYDPSLGEEVCTEDLYPCVGKVGAYSIAEQSSEFVNIDDLKLLLYSELYINKEWKVQYDSKEFQIISIGKTIAQNNLILYTLQLRA